MESSNKAPESNSQELELQTKSELESQVRKIWPNVIGAAEISHIMSIEQNLHDVCINYSTGGGFIDYSNISIVLEYLRSKNIHISWVIHQKNFETTFFGESIKNLTGIQTIVKFAYNGDNLLIRQIENFIDDYLEDLLEAFRNIKFNTIRLGFELADEDLQFIRDVTDATIYFTKNNRMIPFEPAS